MSKRNIWNFCRNSQMNCVACSAILEIALHCCENALFPLWNINYLISATESKNKMTLIGHFHLLGKLSALKKKQKWDTKQKPIQLPTNIFMWKVYGVVKGRKWREIQWYWWSEFICHYKGWASRSQSTSDINLFAHIVGHTIGNSSANSLFGIQFSVDAAHTAPIALFSAAFFRFTFPITSVAIK